MIVFVKFIALDQCIDCEARWSCQPKGRLKIFTN